MLAAATASGGPWRRDCSPTAFDAVADRDPGIYLDLRKHAVPIHVASPDWSTILTIDLFFLFFFHHSEFLPIYTLHHFFFIITPFLQLFFIPCPLNLKIMNREKRERIARRAIQLHRQIHEDIASNRRREER